MADLPATIAVLREMHDARPYAPARQRKALRDAVEEMEGSVELWDATMGFQAERDIAVDRLHAAEAEAQKLRAERDEAVEVVRAVVKWVDDLYPYSDHGTAPAPVFQACKDWLAKLKGALQ